MTVRVSGPSGFTLERSYALGVKPATQVIARRTVRPLAQRRKPDAVERPVRRSRAGNRRVRHSRSVSRPRSTRRRCSRRSTAIRSAARSRSPAARMPLLYVNDLASEAHLSLDTAIDQRIREAIDRLLARQGSNGSFGLWSAGGDDVWLDAYVSDFLTRARERGFAVPDVAVQARARSAARTTSAMPRSRARTAAARSPMRSMCWRATARPRSVTCATTPTPSSTTSRPLIAKAQLAAALGMLGDRARAERVFTAALLRSRAEPVLEYGRIDYGSILRDAAALVTLAVGGRRAAPDHRECGRAGRGGAQPHALHLDAGAGVAGAGVAGAGQGGDRHLAQRCGRGWCGGGAGYGQPQLSSSRRSVLAP